MSKFWLALILGAIFAALLGGCDDNGNATDGDGDADSDGDSDADADGDTGQRCSDDTDCGDGVFCNGEERCSPDSEEADESGCIPGRGTPCDDDETCSEEEGRCLSQCDNNPDADGFLSLPRHVVAKVRAPPSLSMHV